jgi:hypothetical protein
MITSSVVFARRDCMRIALDGVEHAQLRLLVEIISMVPRCWLLRTFLANLDNNDNASPPR